MTRAACRRTTKQQPDYFRVVLIEALDILISETGAAGCRRLNLAMRKMRMPHGTHFL